MCGPQLARSLFPKLLISANGLTLDIRQPSRIKIDRIGVNALNPVLSK